MKPFLLLFCILHSAFCIAFAQGIRPALLGASRQVVAGVSSVKKDEQTTDDSLQLFGTAAISRISSSWVAGSSYNLTEVKIKLAPQETAGGNLSVSIYAADGSQLPTGSSLGDSTSVPVNGLTTYPGGLAAFPFGTAVALTSGTTYALVIIHDTPDSAHRAIVKWTTTVSARRIASYSGTWSIAADGQFVFETWGN